MENKSVVQSKVIDEICKKEKISLYVWLGVVAIQLIQGITFFAYGILLLGVVNAISCFQSYKFMKKIKENPVGVYKHYKDSLVSTIIFIALNVGMGGYIGVAGAIFDLVIRQYVMKNKDELLALEAMYTDEDTTEATV